MVRKTELAARRGGASGAAAKHEEPAPRAVRADVFDPSCPSRQTLERIGDKWTTLVIRALDDGTLRYSDLQRRIGGVSQKMLTQTLRSLERDGLLERRVYPVVPPRVEYSLTPLGRSLVEPLDAICRWAERHLAEMLRARARSARRATRATPGSEA